MTITLTILSILATMRLNRLIQYDMIFDPIREAIAAISPSPDYEESYSGGYPFQRIPKDERLPLHSLGWSLLNPIQWVWHYYRYQPEETRRYPRRTGTISKIISCTACLSVWTAAMTVLVLTPHLHLLVLILAVSEAAIQLTNLAD